MRNFTANAKFGIIQSFNNLIKFNYGKEWKNW